MPPVLIDTLREQWNGLTNLDEQIIAIERRMREWKKDDRAVEAISEIPGVGLLTATAAVAMMGDAKVFLSRQTNSKSPAKREAPYKWSHEEIKQVFPRST